jgi:hypothetical protein
MIFTRTAMLDDGPGGARAVRTSAPETIEGALPANPRRRNGDDDESEYVFFMEGNLQIPPAARLQTLAPLKNFLRTFMILKAS